MVRDGLAAFAVSRGLGVVPGHLRVSDRDGCQGDARGSRGDEEGCSCVLDDRRPLWFWCFGERNSGTGLFDGDNERLGCSTL